MYKIQRLYFNKPGLKLTLQTGLTLEEAQAHCRDPESSSKTCTLSSRKAVTRRSGPWFDSYTHE